MYIPSRIDDGSDAPPPPPLPSDYKPATHITELPATAHIEDILAVLDKDGGVILTDLMSSEDLSNIEKETEKYTSPEGKVDHEGFGTFIPQQTTLVNGLVGKSDTVATLCEHPLMKGLRQRILTDYQVRPQEEIKKETIVEPLLSVSMSFRVGYGAPRQRVHRDDRIHLIDHSIPFQLDKVNQFAVLVAGSQTTRENGATMFVPGSHRWDDKRIPKLDEVTFAEMKAGSALLFLAGSYHGAGHNSLPGSTRIVHGIFFCRGILRTEENQFLAIPQSKALTMSPEMQALLGYKKPDGVALGLFEGNDPMADLKGAFTAVTV